MPVSDAQNQLSSGVRLEKNSWKEHQSTSAYSLPWPPCLLCADWPERLWFRHSSTIHGSAPCSNLKIKSGLVMQCPINGNRVRLCKITILDYLKDYSLVQELCNKCSNLNLLLDGRYSDYSWTQFLILPNIKHYKVFPYLSNSKKMLSLGMWWVSLTQGEQAAVGLQHHISVQDFLSIVHFLPFIPRKVHSEVFKCCHHL